MSCGQAPSAATPAGASDPALRSLLRASQDLGPIGAGKPVSVTLQLVDARRSEREAALAAVYDPASPGYMKFLDLKTQASRFGPDSALSERVAAHLAAVGLQSSASSSLPLLTATGTARAMELEFGVVIHDFVSRSGVRFYAETSAPAIPVEMQGEVQAIEPISSYPRFKSHYVPQGGATPSNLQNAYGENPLKATGVDGSGETVAIYALGDGYNQSALDEFSDKFGLPRITPTIVSGPKNAKEGSELQMDIEAVHAMAPKAAIHIFTNPPSDVGKFYDAILADTAATVWSMSWGRCETEQAASTRDVEKQIYEKTAAAGISVFFASGDSNAFDCLDEDYSAPPSEKFVGVDFPSSLPMGVTSVGGTRISVREDGSYQDEVVWSEPLQTGGEGAGLSTLFDQPAWQRGPGVSQNKDNPAHKRMIPDVVADASPQSGLAIKGGDGWSQGGGTSLSAPLWAGMTALINSYLVKKGLKRVGFLNPALYDLAAGKPAFPPFNDITVGNNQVYSAGPGFDVATGLGSPNVWNLARDLETYQRNGGKP